MAKCNIDRSYYSALASLYSEVGAYSLTGAQLVKIANVSNDIIDLLGSNSLVDYSGSDLNTARKEAVLYLYMFRDVKIVNDAIDMLNRIEYEADEKADCGKFVVLSSAINSSTGAYRVPAKMIVPEDFKKTSSVFMTHEIIHMLKERNPAECRDVLNFGEVLPMLIELIIAYSHEFDNTEKIFGKRRDYIKCKAMDFKEIYEDYKAIAALKDDKPTLAALYESGSYINSFYYTLCLFSLYLKDSNYMLNLIGNVLNCRMTTRELISYTIRDSYSLYEDGLEKFNFSL